MFVKLVNFRIQYSEDYFDSDTYVSVFENISDIIDFMNDNRRDDIYNINVLDIESGFIDDKLFLDDKMFFEIEWGEILKQWIKQRYK